MAILRKNERSIHFSHVPRTAGRSLIMATGLNGWRCHKHVSGFRKKQHLHMFYDEIIREAECIPGFAVVRDPVERFISATRYGARCSDRKSLIDLVASLDTFPDTLERHFHPQHLFVGPKTIIYKYESQFDEMVNMLRLSGLIGLEQEMPHVKDPHENDYEIGDLPKKTLAKIRKWYIEDYKRFGYMP